MSLHTVPVFVSSTWLDLRHEREAVRDAVLRMKETQFVGMEYFGGRDETTRQASLDEVDRSLVYVGVVAGRYGSGITEAEYERARGRGLPCFLYFKDDSTVPDDLRETDAEQAARLDAFRRKLRARHTAGPDFVNPQDLAAKVTADLHRWLFDNYLTPRLQAAVRGELPRGYTQSLLDAVKDPDGLGGSLLNRLRGAGFVVAAGERAAAVSGNNNVVVTGDSNVVQIVNEAPRPAPVPHQLRAPVGDFVGRAEELARASGALRGGRHVLVSGMGGVGKSQLALMLAGRLLDEYPDAHLFVEMRGTDERPRDPAQCLAACARAFLGPAEPLPESLDGLVSVYQSLLYNRRALILLDNAADGRQVRPLLPPPARPSSSPRATSFHCRTPSALRSANSRPARRARCFWASRRTSRPPRPSASARSAGASRWRYAPRPVCSKRRSI